jgi:hypothetical protein
MSPKNPKNKEIEERPKPDGKSIGGVTTAETIPGW